MNDSVAFVWIVVGLMPIALVGYLASAWAKERGFLKKNPRTTTAAPMIVVAILIFVGLAALGWFAYRSNEPQASGDTFSSEESDSLFDWCTEHKEELPSYVVYLFEWEIRKRPVDCGRVVRVVKTAIEGTGTMNDGGVTVWFREKQCVIRNAKAVITNSSGSKCPRMSRDIAMER